MPSVRNYSIAFLTASSLTPPQAVAAAAQLGYSHVGLRLWPSVVGGEFQNLIGDPQMMRETIAALKDTGVGVRDLEVVRIATGFDANSCRPLIEAGAALGARAVLVTGEDPDAQRLAQSYGRLCELALPLGLTVDLEFLPWTAVRDANGALAVLAAAGRPTNAGVLVDALHMARSSSTLADIAALPRECLHYAQICDGPGSGSFTQAEIIHTARFERLLPGEGSIDLRGLFGALPADLPLSIEIPHHIRMPRLGAVEWARQALAASRALLEPAA